MSGMSNSKIIIRTLTESDSLDQLTKLLNRAYKVLADMGLKFVATYQDVEITQSRIKNGVCFIAVSDNNIVGTITYYESQYSIGTPFLESEGISHFGQLAVDPEFQNQGIATELIKYTEIFAQQDGAIELALDTAEPAQHLIDWYKKLGYRFIEYCDWEMTNYRSVIMSKRL